MGLFKTHALLFVEIDCINLHKIVQRSWRVCRMHAFHLHCWFTSVFGGTIPAKRGCLEQAGEKATLALLARSALKLGP